MYQYRTTVNSDTIAEVFAPEIIAEIFATDSIAEVFAWASATGILKYSQYIQLTATLNCSVDNHELAAIERLFYAMRKGYIQLVNDISQSPLSGYN